MYFLKESISKWGLFPSEIEYIQRTLARYPQVDKAFIFGSRAKGNFKPGSDVDLALLGPEIRYEIVRDI